MQSILERQFVNRHSPEWDKAYTLYVSGKRTRCEIAEKQGVSKKTVKRKEVLRSLIGSKTKRGHLAHISKESNTHDTALGYAKKAVLNRVEITALPRKGVSEMYEM